MSPIRQSLERYLALRRGFGAELRVPATRLHRFVDFLDHQGAAVVTTQLALLWATAPTDVTPFTCTQRLAEVRRFAKWLCATDPRTEIPPPDLLAHRYRRRPPYIYSDEEVARILDQAARLPSPLGLRSHTYSTLFGLLAATGLRLGEALALDRDDADLAAGVLSVRRAKFGKSRFVPLHDTTRQALGRFVKKRDLLVPHPASPAFFLSESGTRITQDTAQYTFVVVSRAVGLRRRVRGVRRGRGPRLHDMRHRFAAKVLVQWYRQGRDVEREIPKLATYLGHAHVADTYWYLNAVPEILRLASDRVTHPREDVP